MARKFSRVERYVWRDLDFRSLKRYTKQLWMYLLTSGYYTNIPGLLPASMVMVADEMGEDFGDELKGALETLVKLGWVKVDETARVILLPKALSKNKPQSPNEIKGWGNNFDEIPESPLKDEWLQSLINLVKEDPGKDNGRMDALREAFPISTATPCGTPSPIPLEGVSEALREVSPEGYRTPDPDPDPKPEPIPDPKNSNVISCNYEGEVRNETQEIVKLMMAKFTDWPQGQVEKTVMQFRSSIEEFSLADWEKVIVKARQDTGPEELVKNYHRQISWAIDWVKRGIQFEKNKNHKTETNGFWVPKGMPRPDHCKTVQECLAYVIEEYFEEEKIETWKKQIEQRGDKV